MPHFMIVFISYTLYQFIKPFLNNKMFIFEEYEAFNQILVGIVMHQFLHIYNIVVIIRIGFCLPVIC